VVVDMAIPYTDNITALSAVTSTTTSDAYDISKRQQATVQFVCANRTSGNGVFTIDGSNDGTNWVTGIAFLDATQTTVATFVTSKTLNADGTAGAYITTGFRMIRVKVTRTTDGKYSAIIQNGG
jgi:hypothetical protein